LARDIPKLKAKGVKINLSYGYNGLGPLAGGGLFEASEEAVYADQLATRMKNNIKERDLDGVDIFTLGTSTPGYTSFGKNSGFHSRVIKSLRGDLPPGKTISYTIKTDPCENMNGIHLWHPMEDVIALSHKYLDSIYIELQSLYIASLPGQEECVLNLLINELGVPAHKIGWYLELTNDDMVEERMLFLTNSVRERGLHGLSLFSVNKENGRFDGQLLQTIAEELYE